MSFRLTLKEKESDLKFLFGENSMLKASFDNYIEVKSSDYNELLNKPQINAVELIGDKTSDDLFLQDHMDELSNVDIEALLM